MLLPNTDRNGALVWQAKRLAISLDASLIGIKEYPTDGHTLNQYALPGATGFPVGVSVGHDRRVVAATSDGQVYGFAPG